MSKRWFELYSAIYSTLCLHLGQNNLQAGSSFSELQEMIYLNGEQFNALLWHVINYFSCKKLIWWALFANYSYNWWLFLEFFVIIVLCKRYYHYNFMLMVRPLYLWHKFLFDIYFKCHIFQTVIDWLVSFIWTWFSLK